MRFSDCRCVVTLDSSTDLDEGMYDDVHGDGSPILKEGFLTKSGGWGSSGSRRFYLLRALPSRNFE